MNFKNKKTCTNIAALTIIKKTFAISFLILDPPHQLVVTLLMGTVILLIFKNIYLFNCIRSWLWLAISSLPRIGVSLVVVWGLSCRVAYGILVPSWGIEPTSLALEGRFLATGPSGKSLFYFLNEGMGAERGSGTWTQITPFSHPPRAVGNSKVKGRLTFPKTAVWNPKVDLIILFIVIYPTLFLRLYPGAHSPLVWPGSCESCDTSSIKDYTRQKECWQY